jgi:hypothetical protein
MRNEVIVYLEIYQVYLEIYYVYLEIYEYGEVVQGVRFPVASGNLILTPWMKTPFLYIH